MNIYQKIIQAIFGLERLVFPELCAACSNSLFNNEQAICNRCIRSLPLSYYHTDAANPVIKTFWGRIPLQYASSQYIFRKGTAIQDLLHAIKYGNREDAAITAGKLIALDAMNYEWFQEIDLLIPVPLHPAKEKKRGYNQSEALCKGISIVSQKMLLTNQLIRTENTATQTKKGRFQRWENVEYVFKVAQPPLLENKHVLLIDDVITTGATIEGCGYVLLQVDGLKLSVLSLAHAK
jgi:ComF family protein